MTGKETLQQILALEKEAKGSSESRSIKRKALLIKTECLRKLWRQGGKQRLHYYIALEKAEALLQ